MFILLSVLMGFMMWEVKLWYVSILKGVGFFNSVKFICF